MTSPTPAQTDYQASVHDPQAVVQQVAELCRRKLGFELSATVGGFRGERKAGGGVLAVHGELQDDAVVIRVDLLHVAGGVRVPAHPFFGALAALGERERITTVASPGDAAGSGLAVELRVRAQPMSYARGVAFSQALQRLDEIARMLQEEVPGARRGADERARRYKAVAEVLRPIEPWDAEVLPCLPQAVTEWAADMTDFLDARVSVALVCEHAVEQDVALAALAAALEATGGTLGLSAVPALNPRALIELATRAPGVLGVPVLCVQQGSNLYEEHEVYSSLRLLSQAGRPVLFFGCYGEHQSVFHGGQGALADPTSPVVARFPGDALDLDLLAHFALLKAAPAEGIPPRICRVLLAEILAGVRPLADAEARRLLPMVAARSVAAWASGRPTASDVFVARSGALAETFAGLVAGGTAKRSARVQERWVRRLTDTGLVAHLRSCLFGQERALGELVQRLREECLARAEEQPLRCLLQGTPGTGKSESIRLLAEWLGVPYQVIDAASFSDIHTASAQLLGSGRGIVGSFRKGRLEELAGHHEGAVVEVADLDHAAPAVRASFGDLFLQMLETGLGQSAKGNPFSCANLVIVFSLNLPDGADERLRRSLGFMPSQDGGDLRREVEEELKRLLSNAFVSRVGSPILYDPLDAGARARIVERAVEAALRTACSRLGAAVGGIELAQGLGQALLAGWSRSGLSTGARGLAELARQEATRALLALPGHADLRGRVLNAAADAGSCLLLQAVGLPAAEPPVAHDPE
jgi:hypothetical protein